MNNTKSTFTNPTPDQMNAFIRSVYGPSTVRPVVRDKSVFEPVYKWQERNGVIYFSVTSDGASGENWIIWFETNGVYLDIHTKSILSSPYFIPTTGVTTEVAVLRSCLFKVNDLTTTNIQAEGKRRCFATPALELGCLIRKYLTHNDFTDMGLEGIVTMHAPVNYSDGDPYLLGADHEEGDARLVAFYAPSYAPWFREQGFAFMSRKLIR